MKTFNILFKTVKQNQKLLRMKRYLFRVTKKKKVNKTHVKQDETLSSISYSDKEINKKQIKSNEENTSILIIPDFLNDRIQKQTTKPKPQLERYEAISWDNVKEENKEKNPFAIPDEDFFSIFPLEEDLNNIY